MKIILMLFLCSTLTAIAQIPPRVMDDLLMLQQRAAVPTACITSQTTNAHSVVLEGFGASASPYFEGGWSNITVVGTSANITTNASTASFTTGKPDGACNTALRVNVPNDGTETFIRLHTRTNSLAAATADIYFSFYIDSSDVTGGENFYIMLANDRNGTGTGLLVAVMLLYNSTTLAVRGQGATSSANINIAADQWYVAQVRVPSADPCTLTVWGSGSQIGSATFNRYAGPTELASISLGGVIAVDAGDTTDIYYDLVAFDVY